MVAVGEAMVRGVGCVLSSEASIVGQSIVVLVNARWKGKEAGATE